MHPCASRPGSHEEVPVVSAKERLPDAVRPEAQSWIVQHIRVSCIQVQEVSKRHQLIRRISFFYFFFKYYVNSGSATG